jgi:hypothetical protein
MRTHQEPAYSLVRGLLARSEYVFGIFCDWLYRHRFSCFSELYENAEVVPKFQVATMRFSLFSVKHGNIGTAYGTRRLLVSSIVGSKCNCTMICRLVADAEPIPKYGRKLQKCHLWWPSTLEVGHAAYNASL